MDAAALLGASLAFSVVCLPLLLMYYNKSNKAETKEEIRNNSDQLRKDFDSKLESKFENVSTKIDSLKEDTTKLTILIERLNNRQ